MARLGRVALRLGRGARGSHLEARLAIGLLEPYGPPVAGTYQTYVLSVRGGLTWD